MCPNSWKPFNVAIFSSVHSEQNWNSIPLKGQAPVVKAKCYQQKSLDVIYVHNIYICFSKTFCRFYTSFIVDIEEPRFPRFNLIANGAFDLQYFVLNTSHEKSLFANIVSIFINFFLSLLFKYVFSFHSAGSSYDGK